MSRRIIACAALLALVVSLSACKSSGSDSTANKDTKSTSAPAANSSGTAPAAGGTTTSATVCVPVKCAHTSDCTACYRSEIERNMGRLVDDWPSGGCCCDCPVPVDKKPEVKECCPKK
jgi:hypothetical protein